jgi:hypothetical protein
MAENNLSKIKEMEQIFQQRYARMDTDRDLHLLKSYTLKNSQNKPIKKAISITMNEPRIFSDKVLSLLNAVIMQSVVEGRGLSAKENTIIEEFLDDLFITIDEQLKKKGKKPLRPFIFYQTSMRGTIVTRNLLEEMPGGTYMPNVLQCDSRFATYEFGGDGLLWASAKMFKTKSMIESEYPAAKGISAGSKAIPFREYWDNEVREVYANETLIHTEKNTLGYPPFVIVESASGAMISDEDYEKYHAESIYASVRDLYPEINRLASIVATLTQWSFRGPRQYASEMGELAKTPDLPENDEDILVPVEKGGGYLPFPINDIKNATRMLQSLLSSAIQRATFSNLEYGTLSMPLSAVAIQKMLDTRGGVVLVRFLDAIYYYQQTARMFIDQYINGGIKAIVGKPGIEREYEPKDLDKKYNIEYQFYSQSPEADIANTAVAQQQKALGMAWKTILTKTMKVQDPDGEIAQQTDEQISKTDMAVMLFNHVFYLRDMGDKFKDKMEAQKYYWKSEFVLQQLETLLRQRAAGQMAGYNFGGNGAGSGQKPLLPMMAGGQGGVSPEEEEFAVPPEELEEKADRRATQVRRQTEEG